MSTDEGIRLAKRVAALVPCSRSAAERYIAGGWVTVDAAIVEDPATRVTERQQVALLPGATGAEPLPVTLLLHKPAGHSADIDQVSGLLAPERLEGKQRFLKRHLARLALAVPLESNASGLVVYTQNVHLARKLAEDAERFEQEYVVEVSGQIREDGLGVLNQGPTLNGKTLAPLKVSWQSEKRLRVAGKGIRPGQIEHMCRAVGLDVVAMKRLRVGRVALAGLPDGRWRYLGEFERF